MKRKTGKHLLLLSSFSFAAAYLASEFYSAKKPGLPVKKPDTCFTESPGTGFVVCAICRVRRKSTFGWRICRSSYNNYAEWKIFFQNIFRNREAYLRFKPKAYYDLRNCYLAVWKTWKVFPFQSETIEKYGKRFLWKTPFGAARSYGGSRTHEGCDLFGRVSQSGFLSCDFHDWWQNRKIGWFPLADTGSESVLLMEGIFYYAHLASYEKYFQTGEAVEAGADPEFMGDTGYGEEGMSGKFPVHLHLGIYINHREKRNWV